MPNTFSEKVTRFTPILDEIYAKGSLTAFLEKDSAMWIGTNKIKMPMIDIDGAGDYDRSDGYANGGIHVDYAEYELEFDRGRKFNIDVIDDDEAGFNLYAEAARAYVTKKEIPEVDAVRFSRFAARANTVKESDTYNILEEFDLGVETLDNLEVPEEGRIAFMTPSDYTSLKKEFQNSARWDSTTLQAGFGIERRFNVLDGVLLIKVPESRFYDVVELLDGTTAGQEAGGFQPVALTSKKLKMILADIEALEAYTKRNVSKIISPDQNQNADAWMVAYRNHHDAIVAQNKRNGIYVLKAVTAVA